jgi:hypothetical protein
MKLIDDDELTRRITAEIATRTNADFSGYSEPERLRLYNQHVCFGLHLALAMFKTVLAESELKAMKDKAR